MRATDALTTHVRELKLEAQNAASNPRLVAALRGNADAATLQDLFRTEEWWEPYRNAFKVYAVAFEGDKLDVIEGMKNADFASDLLIRQAREGHEAVAADRDGQRVAVRRGGRRRRAARASRSRRCCCWPGRSTTRRSASWPRRPAAPCCSPTARTPCSRPAPSPSGSCCTPRSAPRGAGRSTSRPTGHPTGSGPRRSARSSPGSGSGRSAAGAAAAHDAEGTAVATTAAIWSVAGVLALGGLVFGLRRKEQTRTSDADGGPGGDRAGRTPADGRRLAGRSARARASAIRRGSCRARWGAARAPRWATPRPTSTAPAGRSPARAATATFGRYLLLDLLGEGGMAQVFTAVTFGAEGFRRTFVVKRLRAELSRDPAVVAQFIDEAKLGSTLVHSNVIPVFDFGKVGDEYYLAQEYILGRDMGRVTTRSLERLQRPASVTTVLYVAARDAAGARVRALQAGRQRPADGHRPPRRLAQQHPPVGARRGEAVRLRHRQGRGARHQDPARGGQGERQLHVARAGARHQRRRARRSVLARPGDLLLPDRRGALPRRDHLRAPGEGGDRPRPRRAGAHRRPPRPLAPRSSARRWRSIRTGATRPPREFAAALAPHTAGGAAAAAAIDGDAVRRRLPRRGGALRRGAAAGRRGEPAAGPAGPTSRIGDRERHAPAPRRTARDARRCSSSRSGRPSRSIAGRPSTAPSSPAARSASWPT